MKDGDVQIASGSEFHAAGPATEKERFPNFVFDLGRMRWFYDAERSVEHRWTFVTLVQNCRMYVGAYPFSALYINKQHLNFILWGTRNQWSLFLRNGVTWSYFLLPYVVCRDYRRMMCRYYRREVGVVSSLLSKLNWLTLQKRRKAGRLTLLYKIVIKHVAVDTGHLLKISACNTKSNTSTAPAFINIPTSKDCYKYCLLPRQYSCLESSPTKRSLSWFLRSSHTSHPIVEFACQHSDSEWDTCRRVVVFILHLNACSCTWYTPIWSYIIEGIGILIFVM